MCSTSDHKTAKEHSSQGCRDRYDGPGTLSVVSLALLCAVFIPVLAFDHRIFSFLNGLHSPYSDVVWLALTTLGDGFMLVIILGAFLTANPRITAMGIPLLLLNSLTVNTAKAFFPSLRPVAILDSVHVVGPLLRSGAFPSGHTAASMAAAITIAYFCTSRGGKIAIIGLGILMSLSRIFVGAHFPSDVLAGMIVSIGLFLLFSTVVWPRYREWVPNEPEYGVAAFRLFLGIELVAALFGLVFYSWNFAESPLFGAVVAGIVLIFVMQRCFRELYGKTSVQ